MLLARRVRRARRRSSSFSVMQARHLLGIASGEDAHGPDGSRRARGHLLPKQVEEAIPVRSFRGLSRVDLPAGDPQGCLAEPQVVVAGVLAQMCEGGVEVHLVAL